MNNDLEKLDLILELFDLYKELLTKKQKSYLSYYYNYDLSLAEIALEFKVSRTAVLLSINSAISKLEYYESKLGLKKKIDELKKSLDSSLVDSIFK